MVYNVNGAANENGKWEKISDENFQYARESECVVTLIKVSTGDIGTFDMSQESI